MQSSVLPREDSARKSNPFSVSKNYFQSLSHLLGSISKIGHVKHLKMLSTLIRLALIKTLLKLFSC